MEALVLETGRQLAIKELCRKGMIGGYDVDTTDTTLLCFKGVRKLTDM